MSNLTVVSSLITVVLSQLPVAVLACSALSTPPWHHTLSLRPHLHTGRRKMTIKMEEKDEEVGASAGAGASASAGAGASAGNSNTQGDEFPHAFYCPLTKKIMMDPVVDTNGESFERSAVTARDKTNKVTGVTYYPNRAMKAIIERELERHEDKGSLRGRVREAQDSLRSRFSRLVEKSALPSRDYRPLPESFYCPITLELIRKPVIDPDGRTFERDAISHWIRANGKSPVTRNALAVNQLRSNEALSDLIEEEKERTDESIHPSIRRWKTEVPTVETGAVEPGIDPDGRTSVFDENGYPTTQAEIDARRLRSNCSCIGYFFLVVVLLAAVLYFPPLMLLFFIGGMLYNLGCSCAFNNRHVVQEE
jgi:hypothetical protein